MSRRRSGINNKMTSLLKVVTLVALVALASGSPSSAEDSFCQGCRSLVSLVSQFNQSTERDQQREVFQRYCEQYYPVSTDYQQGPCPLFVEALFYVFDHTDPITHCDQIGACDAARSVAQPSDDIYEYLKKSNTNELKPLLKQTANGGPVCEFCEQMVRQVKETLEDPNLIGQVKQQLEAFCDYLHVIDQDKECRQYVDKYIDQVFTFIRDLDPKGYCQSISLCSQAIVAESTARNRLTNLPGLADFQNFGIETSVMIGEKPKKTNSVSKSISSPKLSGPGCALCKTVVKELFQFIRENKTEENIMSALEEVCSLIYRPGQKRDQCDDMIKAYTRELLQLLIDETDPEMVCMLLEQCHMANEIPSYNTLPPKTLIPMEDRSNFELADLITALDSTIGYKSNEACFECKLFMKFLQQKMGEPRTQEEIKQWLLTNLCESLPSEDLVESCKSVIFKNSNTFFQAVVGILNPKEACRELGVCLARRAVSVFDFNGGSSRSVLNLVAPRSNSETSKRISSRPDELRGQMCDNCIKIVSDIDDYISKHPIDEDTSVIIDKVCNNLPEGAIRNECTYIVKVFGAEIVEAISTMDNPRQLCSKVYLC